MKEGDEKFAQKVATVWAEDMTMGNNNFRFIEFLVSVKIQMTTVLPVM